MLSVRPLTYLHPEFTCKLHPLVDKNCSIKMVVSCCESGCANRFGALCKDFLAISNISKSKSKQWIWPVQLQGWAPSKYLRECGNNFVSGKPTVQKPKLTLDFSGAWLILKLLYINICRYRAMFCTFSRQLSQGIRKR